MENKHFFQKKDLVELTLSNEKMQKILGGNLDDQYLDDPSYTRKAPLPYIKSTYSESTYVRK